jgi:hypothetical protein
MDEVPQLAVTMGTVGERETSGSWFPTCTVVLVALTTIGSWIAATAVRFGAVERGEVAAVCDAPSAPWWCSLRMLVIQAFLHDAFAIASIALVAIALWRRRAWIACMAVALGTFGMVLYTFTWSAIGVLGGTMVLARLQRGWQEDSHR